jgi:hypothetical protein
VRERTGSTNSEGKGRPIAWNGDGSLGREAARERGEEDGPNRAEQWRRRHKTHSPFGFKPSPKTPSLSSLSRLSTSLLKTLDAGHRLPRRTIVRNPMTSSLPSNQSDPRLRNFVQRLHSSPPTNPTSRRTPSLMPNEKDSVIHLLADRSMPDTLLALDCCRA